MPARDIPGLNLRAYWALGEAGWKAGMDDNLWRLSFLVQSRVNGIVEELPIDPENGDRYILVDAGSPFNNHMAVWDVDIWAYIEPEHGFIIFNNENGHLLRYNSSPAQWVELLSPEAIKEMYESNDNTNEFSNAEQSKLAGIENNATADMSAAEIKEAYESNLNTNAFTDAEKAKLASLSSSRFLGVYPTLTSLQAAHPAPPEGSFAYVDSGPGADIMSYIWDANSVKYVPQASGNSQETPESVKAKYEANDDTNAFTDAEKAKLDLIEAGATGDLSGSEIKSLYEAEPNTNAFTDAEKEKLAAYDPDAPSLPTGGTTGQFLAKASNDDGDAVWQTITIPEPEDELPSTAGQNGKVLGVAAGSPVWVDPPASYPALSGAAGRVLTVKPDESGVLWKTPAVADGDNLYPLGGDVVHNPFIERRARPYMSDFPNDYSLAGATAVISDGTEGLLFTGIGGTEAQRKIIGKPLHSNWKIIQFSMKVRTATVTFGSTGLVLMAADGTFVVFGLSRGNSLSAFNIRIMRYNAAGTWQASFTDTAITGAPTNMHFRIVRTDNNWIYVYYSFDGHTWINITNFNPATNFAAGFNRVGFSGNRTEVSEFNFYEDDLNYGNFSGFLNAGLPILTGKAGRVLMVEENEEDTFWATIPGLSMPINNLTDSYILTVGDMNSYIRMNSASNITLTVPTNMSAGIPIGSSVVVRQVGNGQITLVPQATVILNTPETLKLRKRGSVISLVKVADNEWDVHGDLEIEVI